MIQKHSTMASVIINATNSLWGTLSLKSQHYKKSSKGNEFTDGEDMV